MYQNNFKRVEEKYVLTEKQYTSLMRKIEHHIQKDMFFDTTICNIYFDTENRDLIVNSLEKPVFKEKVRLRSYNVPSLESDVFLEIKSKYKGVVGKRRIKLQLNAFYQYMENNHYREENQIMNEIDYLFQYYKLIPSYFIAYDRHSYKGIKEDIRITIDQNLRSRKENLQLELGDDGTAYFEDNKYIMEIKTLGAMPLWLVRPLSELEIYPTSFSKYGSIYQKDMEMIVC